MIIYKIGSQKERNNLPAYSRPRHRRPPNLNVHFVICRIRNGGAKGVLASRCFVLGVVNPDINSFLSTESKNGMANIFRLGLCGKLE